MIIKLISFIVAVVTAICNPVINLIISENRTETYPVHVQGSIFGGGNDNIEAELKFDPDWITKNDNRKYNDKLAQFAALLSTDVYFREKDVAKGTQNRVVLDGAKDEYTFTAMLSEIGFTDVKHIESYKDKAYEYDSNDSVTMNIGYRCVNDKYDLYVVAVRGCFSAGEWLSAFDSGCGDDNYIKYTGEHPEWTDKDILKGIDVGANRAMEFIGEFMAQHSSSQRKTCVLVTGHSRGGAIANIIGAKLEDDANVRSYTYTFNASSVTTDENAGKYKTIFNIFDGGDMFTDILPFADEKFFRYGRDLTLDISKNKSIKNAVAKLKGRDDFVSASGIVAQYRSLFGSRFADTDMLYDTKSFTENYTDEQSANARIDEINSIIGASGFALGEFFKVSKSGQDGNYTVKVEYCDAAAIFSLSKILTYGASAHGAVKSLFASDDGVCAIADFFMDNAAQISGGHLLINSYVLAKYVG